jgi:transcriptional regulator with XRE-family HTH domain
MFLWMREQPDPTLAAVLKYAREERGMTQEQLAYRADLTTSALSRIERGLNSPAWTTVRRIAHALDISLVDLASRIDAAVARSPADQRPRR